MDVNASLPDYLQRVLYTPAELKQYYERISLPSECRHEPGTETEKVLKDAAAALDFLTVLQRHHLSSIPFENLDLHYSSHHSISIEPYHLFRKIVEKGCGRGGYCMENSGLFGVALRSLGFEVYPTGARVNQAMEPMSASPGWLGPAFNGWNHMVHLVLIAGQRYLVDVGVGTVGPTRPLQLTDASGAGESTPNVAPQHMRLRREPILDTMQKNVEKQAMWTYEIQNDPEQNGPWTICYCFGETEFLPADFTVMNHFTSTSRTSWFTTFIVCTKYLMDTNGEIEGTLSLTAGSVKRRVHGRKEMTKECKTEADRIQALEQEFGIRLTDEERVGIKGMCTELL